MDDDTKRVENADYGRMLERMIAAAGRRVAAGDPEDLQILRRLEAAIASAMYQGITGLMEQGHSLATVARAQGVTRQALNQQLHRMERPAQL